MANRHRGEIEAEIGGAKRRLVLTLGALAKLEAAFGADDLVALTERFGTGRLQMSIMPEQPPPIDTDGTDLPPVVDRTQRSTNALGIRRRGAMGHDHAHRLFRRAQH
jgi:hypothetical protein